MDQYTYDAWNRLVKVQKAYRVATDDGAGGVTLGDIQLGSVVSEMRYDGMGRRIEKKIENSADLDCTYDYYYDGQHLVQTYDGSGNLIKQYVWGNAVGGYVDDLVRIGSSDVGGIIDVYDWVLQGPNYDVRGVIDSTGDLLERYTYTRPVQKP